MSFPMLENPSGEYCYCNGHKVLYTSDEGRSLFEPIDDLIYYESIRFQKGILLFFEDHMLRLLMSIQKKENFQINTEKIYDDAVGLIHEAGLDEEDGNIRVVVTTARILIHLSHVFYPTKDLNRDGIATSVLTWERLDPHVKIFRQAYKMTVAEKLQTPSSFGLPYEVLLTDHSGKITEGSRSNFFVLLKGTVYSPPEELILIGITRKYVLQAVRQAGLVYKEAMFSLEELIALRDSDPNHNGSPALFVTSSPFDILPVHAVENEEFSSAQNMDLHRISEYYQRIVQMYIASHKSDSNE